MSAVYHHVTANAAPVIAKVQGPRDERRYRLQLELGDLPEECREAVREQLPLCFREGETITGAALQQGGLVIPQVLEEYEA